MVLEMVTLNCTLINFPHQDVLLSTFGKYANDFEYTTDGIFRRTVPPFCPSCGAQTTYNGYNTYTKNGLGSVNIGRYRCPLCEEPLEEDRSFWEELKEEFFSVMDQIYQRMRVHHISYEGIAWILELIFPRGKDTIYRAFNGAVGSTVIPRVEDVQIVHYDEQHPRKGRNTKYRLTLLDGVTGRVIAEELLDKKDPETIKEFLGRYLDPDQPTFVVTDLYPSYPDAFEEFFGENLIHQLCLLHLNKRIVQDFPKKPTIEQLLTMYRLLNIFYNRDQEIEVLESLAEKEKEMTQGDEEEYKTWLMKARSIFRSFVHELELKRRREKKSLEERPYLEAVEIFKALMDRLNSFDKKVQKRLRKIEKNWDRFTAFYFVPGAPATNNQVENYYSTSLKTHRKKQFRTDEGIENQMKLSQMKRAGTLEGCKRTLLEVFSKFRPFLAPG